MIDGWNSTSTSMASQFDDQISARRNHHQTPLLHNHQPQHNPPIMTHTTNTNMYPSPTGPTTTHNVAGTTTAATATGTGTTPTNTTNEAGPTATTIVPFVPRHSAGHTTDPLVNAANILTIHLNGTNNDNTLITPTTATTPNTTTYPPNISALLDSLVTTNPALAASILDVLKQHEATAAVAPSIPQLEPARCPTLGTYTTPPSFTTPPRQPPTDTTNGWFVIGPRNSSTPATTAATNPTNDSDDDDDDADVQEITLSQSDFAPSIIPSAKATTTISINKFADLHPSSTPTNQETVRRRYAEGRVNTRDHIKRRSVVVKLAQSTQFESDQAHTLEGLEDIIDAIIASLPLKFAVDRVAILQFDKAIPTRKYGTCYFSYAFLSPHSSNPKTSITPTPSSYTIQKDVETLQSCLHSRLDGPDYFNTIEHLPFDSYHFRVNLPFTNEMDETFSLLIEGITAGLLFGGTDNGSTLTGRYLGYQIFIALSDTYPTVPPHQPLPKILTKLRRRFDIGSIISVKKVRYSKPKPQGKDNDKKPPAKTRQEVHPLLGIMLANNPTGKALHDALRHVCITHRQELIITGNASSQHLAITIHDKPTELKAQIQLAREIGFRQGILHKDSHFSIVRDVRVHSKILSKREYISRATGSYGHCLGFLFDFSRGTLDLRATAIFLSFKETSFITAEQISSRIVEVNRATVNLTPITLLTPDAPTPTSLRSPLGRRPHEDISRSSRRPQPTDRSSNLFRVAATSQLTLGSPATHKFYAIINGIGGIATANVYNIDFDTDGVRSLITHVPYNRQKSFALEQDAWAYFIAHFPHIRTPDDATHMNEHCPCETTNLTNPSRLFQEKSGLCFTHPGKAVVAFTYFDQLPDAIKLTREAGSRRMTAQGLTPIDGYTFEEESPDHTTRCRPASTTISAAPRPRR